MPCREARFAIAVLLALPGAAPVASHAQAGAYPTKPIRMIVPFPPGGGTDIAARLVTPKLAEALGQQIVIDNRGGANGGIGSDIAAKSSPDGYTVLVGGIGTLAINHAMYSTLPYHPARDFAHVTQIAGVPNMLVVHPGLGVGSVKEFIALAKAKAGQMNFSTPGAGSSDHLSMELFKLRAGVSIVHVPYKGFGPSLPDLLSGKVQTTFANLPTVLAHAQSGKLRALAVTSRKRAVSAPDVPTMIESGMTDFDVTSWFGFSFPAKVPRIAVTTLHAATVKAMTPEVRERLVANGLDPMATSPEAFTAHVRSELDRWAAVVKASGAKVE
jgi:tripartite-type tricarboxylate transporter receptor subunit TctC